MAAYRYENSHLPALTREISSSKLEDKFHTIPMYYPLYIHHV